jgi:NADPH:quinone reductase-like Zn-dependent oxidoreductase
MLGPVVHQRIRPLISKVTQQDLLVLKDLLEAGKVMPVIDKTYPLSEVPTAIRDWEHGHAHGKTAITV